MHADIREIGAVETHPDDFPLRLFDKREIARIQILPPVVDHPGELQRFSLPRSGHHTPKGKVTSLWASALAGVREGVETGAGVPCSKAS